MNLVKKNINLWKMYLFFRLTKPGKSDSVWCKIYKIICPVSHYTKDSSCTSLRRVASWLATCAWNPKVLGLSPAASYVQRWALCSNRPANVLVPVSGWNWQWGVKEMPSSFLCSLVICECSWKKSQIEKKYTSL